MDWLPARLVFCISPTFWTLALRDHVTYCQARGLSGHTSPYGECVFFDLEDSVPPEVEEDYFHLFLFQQFYEKNNSMKKHSMFSSTLQNVIWQY